MVTGCYPTQVLNWGAMGASPAAGIGRGGDGPNLT